MPNTHDTGKIHVPETGFYPRKLDGSRWRLGVFSPRTPVFSLSLRILRHSSSSEDSCSF